MRFHTISFLLFYSFLMCFQATSQESLTIALLNDDSLNFSKGFEDLFKQEVRAIQSSRSDVAFRTIYAGTNPTEISASIEEAMGDDEIDILVGLGLTTSTVLSQFKSYSKPSIASIIIDRHLLNLPITHKGTSGLNNFTYIESPFDVKKDLEVFYEITPYKNLAILLDTDLRIFSSFLNTYFEERVPSEATFTVLTVQPGVQSTLDQITDEIDGLYVLSTDRYPDDIAREFYHEINHMGLPTFSLTGRRQVELGALAGMAASNFLPNVARRMAIDILRISEGENASTLPVQLENLGEDFVINMNTLKHLEIYPDFELLNRAILLYLEDTEGTVTWSLESLIFEAIKSNLGISISEKEVLLVEEDVKIAASNLKPQLSASSSATWIDQNRVDGSNGQAASVSWLANATLNQVIYSEPAMANVAIQKLLKESANEELRQAKLDVILESAGAFLNFLQAKSIVRIQNENVDVTNQNLSISESKEALGYSSISDVYRLRTQLSQNVIDLNNALSNLNQARININRILNRDQREIFNAEDVVQGEMISLGSNSELEGRINNQRDLDKMTDLFVKRAFEYLPELKILEYSIQAQERSLLSNNRSLYLPQINLHGTFDQPIKYFNPSTPPQGFPGLSKKPQLGLSAQVSFPIFQGGFRKANIQRDKITIDQLQDNQQDLRNSLEAQLRSNMQILSATYQQLELSQQAADYSKKNFDIIQDLYRQGQADIIRLVDAQNASLFAELNAINAFYQLIIEFLTVERATGKYFFLMSDTEKDAFFKEVYDTILSK